MRAGSASMWLSPPPTSGCSISSTPEPVDPSHAGIFGLRPDDTLIAELIAQVVQETYPAKV